MSKRGRDGERRDDRRARVEELKRAQKAAEKRKNLIIAGVCIVIAGGLIAIPVVGLGKDKAEGGVGAKGSSTAEAACDPILTDKTTGMSDHVKQGVHVDYASVPPSSGQHFEYSLTVSRRGFYTTKDTPTVEQLVHNLEHGYTVAWYLPSISGDQKKALQEISSDLRDDNTTRKFIAAPWDLTRGEFPAGKTIALSHWGAKEGHRQFCGQASGASIGAFMEQYPATDSPEPNTP